MTAEAEMFKMLTPGQGFFDSGKDLGKWGEQQALDFLKKKGLVLLEKNYHTRWGELDLILQDGGQIVFVEVKTRISQKFGTPEESFNPIKRRKLEQAIEEYLAQKDQAKADYRLDLITIIVNKKNQTAGLKYFESVD